MRHPTEGVLRRVLDEPAGVSDADREHVGGCAECLEVLALMRVDAALVGAALANESVAGVDLARDDELAVRTEVGQGDEVGGAEADRGDPLGAEDLQPVVGRSGTGPAQHEQESQGCDDGTAQHVAPSTGTRRRHRPPRS